MVLWEHKKSSVKDLGEKLHLDSGTLTPLLKGLESKGYITRKRSDDDERCVTIELTADGELMKDKAADIPAKMAGCVKLDREEASVLYKLLYKILDSCQD